jgi:hypothetical protein
MAKQILFLAMLLMIGGCTSLGNRYEEHFSAFPEHYSQFDLKMAWETKLTDTGTVIDGMVKNVRYPEMIGVEVWAAVLDGNGTAMGRSMSFIIPVSLREGEIAPFGLTIPVRAVAGGKLQFTYRYSVHEGHEDRFHWMQSFEVPPPR